jgi:membrane-associated HD superfamily phosphohydrolase
MVSWTIPLAYIVEIKNADDNTWSHISILHCKFLSILLVDCVTKNRLFDFAITIKIKAWFCHSKWAAMRYNLWIIFFLEKNLTWVKLYKKEYKFSVNYFCAIQFLFCNVVLISVIKFNSSLPFRLYIYVMLLLPPLSYDSAIKKRKWYIYFLINYDNNWLPVNTVHANCLVRFTCQQN